MSEIISEFEDAMQKSMIRAIDEEKPKDIAVQLVEQSVEELVLSNEASVDMPDEEIPSGTSVLGLTYVEEEE